jgi:hypothetical protein
VLCAVSYTNGRQYLDNFVEMRGSTSVVVENYTVDV